MHEIERDALSQLKVLAESPLPTDYVAVMPDAHLGKGVTIGTVFASENYVCPNAVGVDIGCGVAAIPIEGLFKWQIKPDELVRIQQLIKERIPVGFKQHRKTLDGTKNVIDMITGNVKPSQFLAEQLTSPRVTDQLGTLGGGNHFLELVCEENSGQVWFMLHSGSRNIGNRVATHYD
jgi:tRNA-splicing ligase RtcB